MIGALLCDLDNKDLFQKSDRYKISIFYIKHIYYNSILINIPSRKLIGECTEHNPQCVVL